MTLDYLDFELTIGRLTGQAYPLTLLRSPAGEAHATLTWPFGELALENRLKDLDRAIGVGRLAAPSSDVGGGSGATVWR